MEGPTEIQASAAFNSLALESMAQNGDESSADDIQSAHSEEVRAPAQEMVPAYTSFTCTGATSDVLQAYIISRRCYPYLAELDRCVPPTS